MKKRASKASGSRPRAASRPETPPVESVPPVALPPPEEGTIAFQVRFDADLHAQVKHCAEHAGISMNQLIQGIVRGALDHFQYGEPWVDAYGVVNVRPRRGCVFFGRPGDYPEDGRERSSAAGLPLPITDPGTIWFGLDYTNRGVVQFRSTKP